MEKVYYIIDSYEVRFYRIEGGELVLCSMLGEFSYLDFKVYFHVVGVDFDFDFIYRFILEELSDLEYLSLAGDSALSKSDILLRKFKGLSLPYEFIKL